MLGQHKSTVKFYLDTSIWLDIIEKRGYHGEIAKQLMEKIILGGHEIVYSDVILKELKDLGYAQDDLYTIISIIKRKTQRVHKNDDQIAEAKKRAKQRNIPYGDVLHAVIARDNEAQLISRDQDFLKLKDIAKVQRPEDII